MSIYRGSIHINIPYHAAKTLGMRIVLGGKEARRPARVPRAASRANDPKGTLYLAFALPQP